MDPSGPMPQRCCHEFVVAARCIQAEAMNVLGQAATVAQLAGIDAGSLISMIVQAVQTVQRNKEECRQLMHHVMIIGDLLPLLQQSEMMQRPEITVPLDGLADTLRQAYMLVTSCQQSNIMYRFFMAANQAQKFRDVRDRIDSYLRIYPLISHIDTRYFLSRLHGPAHPSSGTLQPQASDEVVGSFRSVTDQNFRTGGSAFNDNDDTEPVEVGAVTNSFAVEEQGDGTNPIEVGAVTNPFAVEQQGDGYANAEVLPNKWYRFTWLVWRTQRETSTIQRIHGLIDRDGKGGFTIFKLSQLAAATNNFSSHHIIGRGGYGDVYEGKLPSGVDVAIKVRCGKHTYRGDDEFENEVRILSKLQHANIVRLLGCCIEGQHRTLVYEYVPGGSLHYILNELRAGVSLDWPMRFRIIKGIVHGAVYLHHHSRLRVVHGDLKASNILLDSDMTPLICDFGLATVIHSDEDVEAGCVRGTLGYLEPEYCRTGILSMKSDVYSFGAIFLEIISAQRAVTSFSEGRPQGLVDYAWELWSSGRAMELVDPSLCDDSQISEILCCLQIALLCVQPRIDRPTMSDVLMMLKCASMTLPDPRPPMTFAAAAGSASTSYTSAECTAEEIERSLIELGDVNSDRPVTFD